jgi:hypothetical protein
VHTLADEIDHVDLAGPPAARAIGADVVHQNLRAWVSALAF